MGKNLSNIYSQKLLDTAKKSTTDTMKTASKRAIQKTGEATGDSIGNKTADKTTIVSTDLHSKKFVKELPNDETKIGVDRATPKKRYISLQERKQIIDELRLV